MTRIWTAPEDFAAEAMAGYCNAYSDMVRRVDGGVVRARPGRPGKVAIVIGGGSGHYPAFAGLVGSGLADGAAMGEVFASPSVHRIVSVARSVESGAGVLLMFGNYQGDVLNFTAAAEQLRGEGIDARILAVTDDIASAPHGSERDRRGVAGDLFVFKVASAAAESGEGIDEVFDVAVLANNRTRTFGVAFTGCTLPGSTTPLFSVPKGKMALGMGIHGEPGLRESDLVAAPKLAELLVAALLEDSPAQPGKNARAAVVLNGLGSTKQEELFVLWSHVARLLCEGGVDVIAPEVGEFATSLDMAGCSLTLSWLDDRLLPLWLAPANTVAFRRGVCAGERSEVPGPSEPTGPVDPAEPVEPVIPAEVDPAAMRLVALIDAAAGALAVAESELGQLDAKAGDGDHGQGMARGSRAASLFAHRTAEAGGSIAATLHAAGTGWADEAGGTSGMLWGEALQAAASIIDGSSVDEAQFRNALVAAVDRIVAVGGATPGDKTMVDAAWPLRDRLSAGDGWRVAVEAVEAGARGTAALRPMRGRARIAGDRNIGDLDPGAVSFALVARAVLEEWEKEQ